MTLPAAEAAARRLRVYRLWRTSTLLGAIGAVEFAVLAWQRRSWLVALACLPLVGLALFAARRARAARTGA